MASRKQEVLGRYLDRQHGNTVGEEEQALASEGGACEKAALKRRSSDPLTAKSGFDAYLYPNLAPPSSGDPGLILAWPIEALIDFFHTRSSNKKDRAVATQAVNDAIAQGTFSGDKFNKAVWLTFGWAGPGKYNQYGDGVPEVRASVVKKVRSGDPKYVAFYKAALKSGYTPAKGDPGLAQMP